MKTWFSTGLKVIGAALGVLVAAYTIGFGGATTLYHLFKSERAEAEMMMDKKLDEREFKISSIHKAEYRTLNDKIDLLGRSQENMSRRQDEMFRYLRRNP